MVHNRGLLVMLLGKKLMGGAVMGKSKLVLSVFAVILTAVLVGFGITPSEASIPTIPVDAEELGKMPEMKIVFGHMDVMDPTYLQHGNAVSFKNYVEAASKGKIKVEVVGGGALGDVTSLTEQVMEGQIQLAGSVTEGNLNQIWPDVQCVAVPYAFPSVHVALDVIDHSFGKELIGELNNQLGTAFVSMVFLNGGLRNYTNSVREIRTPEDMKGLKFRTMAIPAHMKIVEALGATAIPIAWTETYTALQTGVVDGQENAIPSCLQGKMEEVQKYMITDGHVASFMLVLMNKQFYDDLPPLYREIVDAGLEYGEKMARRLCDVINVLGRQKMVEAGVQIYDPTSEELALFREKTKPVEKSIREEMMKDPTWIDRMQKAIEESKARLGYPTD